MLKIPPIRALTWPVL